MDNLELIKLAHMGDKEARDKLVFENTGLIWSIVKRFVGRGHEAEDLFQIGCIGILKAIDKFDMTYDVKFSTYAVPMIMGEIKRFIRDDGMVKVSRLVKENGWRIRNVEAELMGALGREPTIEEIASRVEMSREDVVLTLEANRDVESINRVVYENDGNEVCVGDQVADKSNNEELVNRIVLNSLLKKLSDKEKLIIEMRYFLDKTQSQVAENLGISQVQVSRLEKKILLGLRENMEC
ncbi:MAG: SigF/SigG family RNA polymerase sporulation sigma factor [Lachnospiraceae bacterium]|nr:SigF/SigG family RNA polymerase sporulation sigma factor [Lachnospiraceae bacterium]